MENNTSLQQQLLEAGVHFGDLNKTVEHLQETAAALKSIARSGKKIMFVGTKKQAKEIVTECAKRVNMPFVTERWLGGMLTNFNTVRKSVKKMQSIEKMLNDGTFDSITKKERLTLSRDKEKMEKVLGGIAQLGRVPAALFIIDIGHEHIALAEAKRLGVATFGMVDTNCDPNKVDFAIPSNDDATKSIAIITNYIVAAIAEGLAERQNEKSEEESEEEVVDKGPRLDIDEAGGADKERGGRTPGSRPGAGGNRGGGAPGGQRKRTTGGPGGPGRRPGGGR